MKATSLRKRASDGDIELHRKRIELESEFIQDFKEKVLRKLEDLDRQLHRMKLEYLVIRDSRVSASHDYSVQNRMAMLEEEINRAVQEFFTNQEPNTLKKVSSEVHQKPPSNPPPKISTPSLPLSSSPIRDQAPSVTAARSSPDSQLKHKRSKRAVITPEMQVLPDLMPIFPIYVGVFKVLSLGVVCLEPGYHTERYIYPIGYSIQRQFQSSLHKDSQTTYTCSILQGEPGQGPVFDVISEDNPGGRVSGHSPTHCWTRVARAVNVVRERTHGGSVNGPDYFGLTQGLITYWLQKLPNATKLPNYVFQDIQLVDQRQSKKVSEKKQRGTVLKPSS